MVPKLQLGKLVLEAPASLLLRLGFASDHSRIYHNKVLKQSFKAIRRSQAGTWERAGTRQRFPVDTQTIC